MIRLLEALADGVSLGSVYALIALGFVIIFRATGVLNFAHGGFLLAGAFTTVVVSEHAGFWVGIAAGLFTGGALAAAVNLLLIRLSRDRSHIGLTILTLGVNIIIVAEVTRRIGDRVLPLRSPWGASLVELGPITVPAGRIVALLVAGLIIGVFLAAFRLTRWGLSLRVSAADNETAALMGVRLTTVSWTSWAIGGLMAVTAGLFLASFPSPGVGTSLQDAALRAFPAAVIGGLGSVPGAMVGGLLLGVAESVTATYEGSLGAVGAGLSGLVPYLLLFAVLLVRPDGLFGKKEVARV